MIYMYVIKCFYEEKEEKIQSKTGCIRDMRYFSVKCCRLISVETNADISKDGDV